ncbi:hypothetical protein [Citrobacter sp. NCU1]|uniref:hypothetical protein n=1 Tax=Citrobacter sp. NCU1 TaxID=2026683 RepID=UPI001391FF8B|nr:hypothetical protein [Citrobacter sp. NCU1]
MATQAPYPAYGRSATRQKHHAVPGIAGWRRKRLIRTTGEAPPGKNTTSYLALPDGGESALSGLRMKRHQARTPRRTRPTGEAPPGNLRA